MSESIHILLAAHDWDTLFVRSIERYVEKHDLPWTLTLLDKAHQLDELPYNVEKPDALILGGKSFGLPNWWYKRKIPTIAWHAGELEEVTSVYWDENAIGKMAARHFANQGIRAVATIRPWNIQPRKERYKGFQAEARALGLKFFKYKPPGYEDADEADTHLLAWLSDRPHPIGVFLHQDRDAIWLLKVCKKNKLRVPDQISVLGADDLPVAKSTDPPLSSIAMPRARIGATIAVLLHRRLCGGALPTKKVLVPPMTVAVRKSSTPHAFGDPVVEKVRRKLAGAPQKTFSGEQLAKIAGMSLTHLHRRFKAACGQTPGAFLNSCRLQRAQELLANSDLPHHEISKRCGFKSIQGLWKLFKNAGLPAPLEWRASLRGDEVDLD